MKYITLYSGSQVLYLNPKKVVEVLALKKMLVTELNPGEILIP